MTQIGEKFILFWTISSDPCIQLEYLRRYFLCPSMFNLIKYGFQLQEGDEIDMKLEGEIFRNSDNVKLEMSVCRRIRKF